jgi:hypothetical protein
MSIKKIIYFHDIIECSILIIQKPSSQVSVFLGDWGFNKQTDP